MAHLCLQWDVTSGQMKNAVESVIKHYDAHKAGVSTTPGSYDVTCSLETAPFSERVAASHAVQKLIDGCGSSVSHYPECTLVKKYRVEGLRPVTPSLVPTARLKALLSPMHMTTHLHDSDSGQLVVLLSSSPSGESPPKDDFA